MSHRSLAAAPAAPQSRGFGSEFRFPDQVSAFTVIKRISSCSPINQAHQRTGHLIVTTPTAHPFPPPRRAAPLPPRPTALRPLRQPAPLHRRARLMRTTISTAELQLSWCCFPEALQV